MRIRKLTQEEELFEALRNITSKKKHKTGYYR